MQTPPLQPTIRSMNDGEIFEIYAYRKLTSEETDRQIALFRISKRPLTYRYKIVSEIARSDATSMAKRGAGRDTCYVARVIAAS
jgi:hypothetical protein